MKNQNHNKPHQAGYTSGHRCDINPDSMIHGDEEDRLFEMKYKGKTVKDVGFNWLEKDNNGNFIFPF